MIGSEPCRRNKLVHYLRSQKFDVHLYPVLPLRCLELLSPDLRDQLLSDVELLQDRLKNFEFPALRRHLSIFSRKKEAVHDLRCEVVDQPIFAKLKSPIPVKKPVTRSFRRQRSKDSFLTAISLEKEIERVREISRRRVQEVVEMQARIRKRARRKESNRAECDQDLDIEDIDEDDCLEQELAAQVDFVPTVCSIQNSPTSPSSTRSSSIAEISKASEICPHSPPPEPIDGSMSRQTEEDLKEEVVTSLVSVNLVKTSSASTSKELQAAEEREKCEPEANSFVVSNPWLKIALKLLFQRLTVIIKSVREKLQREIIFRYVLRCGSRSELVEILTSSIEMFCARRQKVRGVKMIAQKASVESDECDLIWSWGKVTKINESTSKINHFPGVKQLSRKDLLAENIRLIRERSTKASKTFDIVPMTFILPRDFVKFVLAFTRNEESFPNGKNYWILKPIGLSRGRGITLHNEISTITYDRAMVAQSYIAHPFLMDGYKFDLRLYALVTSFSPLKCFLYKHGFVRKCSKPYTLSNETLEDQSVHLTNSSLQFSGGGTDNKLPLSTLFDYLRSERVHEAEIKQLEYNLRLIVLKVVMSVERKMDSSPNSFELLGLDVILDKDLRPWVLEVNTSPSLEPKSDRDRRIKTILLADVLEEVFEAPKDCERIETGFQILAPSKEYNSLKRFC